MCMSELPSLRACISNLLPNFRAAVRQSGHLPFCRFRRKGLEHLRYTFVQVLFILRGLFRQRVLGTSAPDQLLGLGVIQVDYQGSYLVVLFRRGRGAEPSASKSSPAPSPAEAVIESLK